LDAVLHAPQVQSLERVWRSLAFLVSRMEFRKGLRLSALHAPVAEFSDRVNRLLIDPIFDDDAPSPNLIVAEHMFANSAVDMEILDELAQHGASLPAVVLAGVSTEFFGVQHSWQIPTLPPFVGFFDQWQFAKWKSLRNQNYARSLGVSVGRFMLRSPHDRDGSGGAFSYREERVSERQFLWGSGAIAGAANIARSVADIGWPTAFSGMGFGRLEEIPTATGGKKGDKTFGPSDIQLREDRITELGMAGLNTLVTVPKVDDAVYWTGISCGRPTRQEPSALMELSLPYQLFAGRLGALMFELKPRLRAGSGDAVGTVRAHVCDWLKLPADTSDDVLSIQTRPAEDQSGAVELAVTVTPPHQVLPGAIPVVIGYRIS
jgi:type VI secretion system protein ImpC